VAWGVGGGRGQGFRWNGGAGWDRSHGHLPRRSFANLLVPYPNEPRAPRQQNHET